MSRRKILPSLSSSRQMMMAWNVRGQDLVELIEGHEAALLGLLDHLLDGSIRQVEQRRRRVRGILLRGIRCLVVFFLVLHLQRLCLAGHSSLSKTRFVRMRGRSRLMSEMPLLSKSLLAATFFV